MQQVITIPTLSALPQAARQLLHFIGDRRIVAIYGAMGAGKTTLIAAICKALGVSDQISSPTFTIVNEYMAADGHMVYHFDFYRITKLEEAYDLGYDEYFDSGGLCLIEWPELIENLLPPDSVRLHIREESDGTREIVFG